jgi:hypothetical protein
MYKVLVDTLVLDRGAEAEERFLAVVGEGTELVDENGHVTKEGQELTKKAMTAEAVKAGAKVISESGCVDGGNSEIYGNDVVYAFNGGDAVMGESDLLNFMEDNGLVIKQEELKVSTPISTEFKLGGAYKQPVTQIVKLLIDDIVGFIVERFSWAGNNEVLIRAIVKMFAGANGVEKYTDKIFADVQVKLK